MIRFRRLTPVSLNSWLVDQGIPQQHEHYRLRVWREVHAALGPLREELIAYVQESLSDARRRIRSGFQDDLSPFNDPTEDPAAHYPAMLNVNSHPTATPFSRPIATPLAHRIWAYPW